jgi:type VI secretion system protein ImpH
MGTPFGPPDAGLEPVPDPLTSSAPTGPVTGSYAPDAKQRRDGPASNMEAMARALRKDPWQFEFFEAVWLLEEIYPGRARLGTFDAGKEAVRFGVNPSLGFPPSDIHDLQADESAPWNMTVNLLGLTGSSGVLPHFYSDMVIERDRKKDRTLRDFLDLFHHRLLSLFYRAWKKPRLPVRYQDPWMVGYLASLVGLNLPALRGRQEVDDQSILHYAGLIGPDARPAVALEQLIEDYFGVPAEVLQFVGAWREIEGPELCTFESEDDESVALGTGTVVGDAIWDQQSRVRVRLGPLSLAKYEQFLPGAEGYRRLQTLTRFFGRDQYDFEVQLVLRRDEVPQCQLEDDETIQLGWTTWMKTRPEFPRHPDDTVMLLA